MFTEAKLTGCRGRATIVNEATILRVYLVVREPVVREVRWYGTPRRGVLGIGSAPEGDVRLVGHNIASRHLQLDFGAKGRVRIEVRHPWGVRLDGRPPRADDVLAPGGVLSVGTWELSLESAADEPSSALDDAFFAAFAKDPNSDDDRLVYADSLEERGGLAEAELVRASVVPTPQHRVAELAVRTPPLWRCRLFGLPIEGCQRTPDAELACPGRWMDLPPSANTEARGCATCGRRVVLCADIGSARHHASQGLPVALDPAVRRWPDDLREPARKRLVIEMGRPARR